MIKPTDIRNWQVNIDDPLTIVEGVDDIAQCVYIILTTIPGSDPLRPEFGSNVYKYLDRPMSEVKAKIIYAATDAIGRWEKRLDVTRCTVTRKNVNNQIKTIITTEGIVKASAGQVTVTTEI